MSASSSSPEPSHIVLRTKAKATKTKKNATSTSQASGRGRNEGVDPTWAYKPPQDFALLDSSSNELSNPGVFDWDAVADNPDLELWLIRVPEAIKPKTLDSNMVHLPASSSKSAQVGMIHRKHASFDIWAIGEDDDEHIGEEIKSISCLLPKSGALYPAPKPIARHLVIAAQPVVPTSYPASANAANKNPPRQCYPKELLKHRFLPIGALTSSAEDGDTMDVDIHMELEPPQPEQAPVLKPKPSQASKKQKKAKEKARKVNVDVASAELDQEEPEEGQQAPTQTQKRGKKEKKDKKVMESLSQTEVQVESTALKVKTQKRKNLADGEIPVGTTPKKAKRAKLSVPA